MTSTLSECSPQTKNIALRKSTNDLNGTIFQLDEFLVRKTLSLLCVLAYGKMLDELDETFDMEECTVGARIFRGNNRWAMCLDRNTFATRQSLVINTGYQ